MSVKGKILGYFKRIFNINKSRETTPIKITEITKLGSDLDDYVNKLLNILPKIEQARTGVLSEFGARIEGIDESLKEVVEELDKMKNYPQISKDEFNTWLNEFENEIKARLDELEKKTLQVSLSELEKFERVDTSLNEIADELEKMKSLPQISEDELKLIEDIKKAKEELQGLDRNSLEKYTLSLEAAALFSDVDELPIESDEEIREHDKEIQKAVARIAPAIIKTRIDKFENEINERINELKRIALQVQPSELEKFERVDTSLNEIADELEKMKSLLQIGEDELKLIEDIKKTKEELQGLDRNSLEKYTLSLEAAALFSDVDELPIESDEEIREHDKEIQKAVARIAPAIIKTRIDKFENEINEQINELQKKALQAPSSKIFDESRISHFIGVLDYKKGLYQKALENFEDIVKINPTNEGWLNKGAALGMLGEFEEESACYEEALKDPEYQNAWINKGLAFLDKDDKKAEACFTKACEIILTKQEKD